MEFTISFGTTSNLGAYERKDIDKTTLNDVEFIRKNLNIDLPLEKIGTPRIDYYFNPKIKLNEETAKMISKFWDETNHINVIVPESFLNQYEYKDIYVDKDNETNEIVKAGIKYKLNEEKIISDWTAEGTPEFWGFPVEEKKGILNKIKKLFK